MKKLTAYLITIAMMFFCPCRSEDLTQMQADFDQAVGVSASEGMATGIGISMMGWGLAIIVGISILAIVLHQSASTAHSGPPTTQGGTSSGVGSLL